MMSVVGRGDDHGVALPRRQQIVMRLEAPERRVETDRQLGPVAALFVRVADRGDHGPVEVEQVADVFDTHHPGPDDAVAERLCHGWVSYGR